jgi:hypothetical protein
MGEHVPTPAKNSGDFAPVIALEDDRPLVLAESAPKLGGVVNLPEVVERQLVSAVAVTT